jgi:hypothetical protein
MSEPFHPIDRGPAGPKAATAHEDLQDARLSEIETELKRVADAVKQLEFRLDDLSKAIQVQFKNLQEQFVARR